jgi:hypothetical protein
MEDLNKYKLSLSRLLKTVLQFPLKDPDDLQKKDILKRHILYAPGITNSSILVSVLLTFDLPIGDTSDNQPCLHLSISENGVYDGYSVKPHYRPKITNAKELQAWFDLFFRDIYPGYEYLVDKEEITNGICTHFRLYFEKVGGKPVLSNFPFNSIKH